jgi:hypothetical protein
MNDREPDMETLRPEPGLTTGPETNDDPVVEDELTIEPAGAFDFAAVELSPPVRPRRRGPDPITRALVMAVGAALVFSFGVKCGRSAQPPAAPPAQTTGSGSGAEAGPGTGKSQPAGGTAPRAGAAPSGPGEPSVTGRLKVVSDEAVYITDANGQTTKVILGPDTKLLTLRPGALADLEPGHSVVVQGKRGPDGTITAATVTDNGPG